MALMIERPNRQDRAALPGVVLRALLKDGALVAVLTTLVGLSMSVMRGTPALYSLAYAWSIGLSILLVSYLLGAVSHLLGANKGLCAPPAMVYVLAVPLGGLIGVLAGTYLNGDRPGRLLQEHPEALATAAVGALVFGTAITYYFHARQRLAEEQRKAQEQTARRAHYEQRLTETELRLLQAQIEPHFLFNTLSNVQALIGSDPARASAMLDALTRFLRASLKRTRAADGTLGEELALIEDYLSIHAVRMGKRLSHRIDCEPGLEHTRLPPLLIQPLVENAIRHGLEPDPRGGAIEIQACQADDGLVIEVADTGLGLETSSARPPGVGLRNIRERIEALYGPRARLEVLENRPHGVRARIHLPWKPTA